MIAWAVGLAVAAVLIVLYLRPRGPWPRWLPVPPHRHHHHRHPPHPPGVVYPVPTSLDLSVVDTGAARHPRNENGPLTGK